MSVARAVRKAERRLGGSAGGRAVDRVPSGHVVGHASLSLPSGSRAEAKLLEDLWFRPPAAALPVPPPFNASRPRAECCVSPFFPSATSDSPVSPACCCHAFASFHCFGHLWVTSPHLGQSRTLVSGPSPFTSPALPPTLCLLPSGAQDLLLSSWSTGSLWPPATCSLQPPPTIPRLPASFEGRKGIRQIEVSAISRPLHSCTRTPTPGLHCPPPLPPPKVWQKEASAGITCQNQSPLSHRQMTSVLRCFKCSRKCCSVVEPKSEERVTSSFGPCSPIPGDIHRPGITIQRLLRSGTGRQGTWVPRLALDPVRQASSCLSVGNQGCHAQLLRLCTA